MKFLIIILFSLFFTGCERKDELVNDHIILKNREVNVYSDTYLYDLFDIKNINLISKNMLIDTESLGKKEYKIEYKIENKKYIYNLEYEVKDMESPRYFGSTYKTITKNYEGNLCNLVMYGDNYDSDLKCEIQGNYNLSKEGTYKVVYKISDDSLNTLDINVTLNVVDKIKSSNSGTTKKTDFKDIYKKYKTENTEIGIDVSKWQGDINFEKVKEAGATFVMMRIGVQTKQNGELTIDPYFKQNLERAKNAGLKVGVYLYSIATSKNEAINHANWVIDTLNKENLELPIVFDWENWSKWNTYKLSFYDINDIANSFLKTIENNGYKGMLYSSKYYLENIWTNKLNYPVWLAHYTNKTNYKGDYMMWQLSNTGKIDGIYGDVDINVLYKN